MAKEALKEKKGARPYFDFCHVKALDEKKQIKQVCDERSEEAAAGLGTECQVRRDHAYPGES